MSSLQLPTPTFPTPPFGASSTGESSFGAFSSHTSSFGSFPTGSFSHSFSTTGSSDFLSTTGSWNPTATADYGYYDNPYSDVSLGSATLFGFILRIVAIILFAITDIACVAIAITAVCKVRKRRDPARRFVPWMQAGLFITAAAGAIQLAGAACQFLEDQEPFENVLRVDSPPIYRIGDALQDSTEYLFLMAELIVFVALVLFDNGICLMKPLPVTKRRTGWLYTVYAFFGGLAMMQTISWVIDLNGTITPEHSNHSTDLAGFYVGMAASAVLGLGIIALLVRSIVLRVRFRKDRHVRRLSKYYLACTSVFVLTILFHFLFHYLTLGFASRAAWIPSRYVSQASDGDAIYMLAQCVLQFWILFIILTILFAEGLKRRHSLFTAGAGDRPLMQETAGLAGTSLHAPSTGSLISPFAPTESEMESAPFASASMPSVARAMSVSTSNEPASTATRSTAPPSTVGESYATASTSIATSSTSRRPGLHSSGRQFRDGSSTAESHDHFPWAIPDEAPPEYTAPERPLPTMQAGVPAVSPAVASVYTPRHTATAAPHETQSEASGSAPSETTESTELTLPPSHDQAMGLNHQADGLRTRSEMPYPDIPDERLNFMPRDKKS